MPHDLPGKVKEYISDMGISRRQISTAPIHRMMAVRRNHKLNVGFIPQWKFAFSTFPTQLNVLICSQNLYPDLHGN